MKKTGIIATAVSVILFSTSAAFAQNSPSTHDRMSGPAHGHHHVYKPRHHQRCHYVTKRVRHHGHWVNQKVRVCR
ncbi:hypothetical protein NCHU2750_20430 [Neorhizobium sp. NCHU2750]|nr:hypothetical protein NCHU2750_20430 [Neorhizobium sp. NCHU2750]